MDNPWQKVENIVAKGEIARFCAISSFVTMVSKSCLLQRRQKASIWGKGLIKSNKITTKINIEYSLSDKDIKITFDNIVETGESLNMPIKFPQCFPTYDKSAADDFEHILPKNRISLIEWTKSGKHCDKRRNYSFWAISSNVTLFSKSRLLQTCQKVSIWEGLTHSQIQQICSRQLWKHAQKEIGGSLLNQSTNIE